MNDDFSYGHQRYSSRGSNFTSPQQHPAMAAPPQQQNMAKVFGRPTNTTRVLLLQDFAPELKTRDLLAVFQEWEDQGDGFRIKWIDDQSAYIVFFDPITAKKAFLATISNLPPSLAPSLSNPGAKLTPYNGPDAPEIVETAAKRPRSRSNAGHQRNYSGSYSHSLHSSISGQNLQGMYMNGGGSGDFSNAPIGGRHGRSDSLGTRFAFPGPQGSAIEGGNSSPEEGGPRNGGGHQRSGSTGSAVGGSPVNKADREAAAKRMTEVLGRS